MTERQENYGSPDANFAHIARLWNAQFGWDVSAEEVALAMVLMKLSRLYRTPRHRDSAIDVVGYMYAYAQMHRKPVAAKRSHVARFIAWARGRHA